MVDLFVAVLLSGFAVTFVIELLALLTSWFFEKEVLYTVLSLPLSFVAMYIMFSVDKGMFISVPATAFIALVLKKNLNAPNVTSMKLRRL